MRLNEVLQNQEIPQYAIKVIKSGLINQDNKPDWEVTYYLKNPDVAIQDAESLMDICAFQDEQPTIFFDKNAVIEKAKEIQQWCQKRKHQLEIFGKHVDFFVKPVIWKGRE